jgi:DNA-binding MarR family transcriptional regulator
MAVPVAKFVRIGAMRQFFFVIELISPAPDTRFQRAAPIDFEVEFVGRRSRRTYHQHGDSAARALRHDDRGRRCSRREGLSAEMHQIRYFLAVCQTLNFTRAAEDCHVSQPALSRAVRQLEAELGGELLRRERSLTQITDLGRAVLPSLQQCYEGRQTAKSLAQSYLKEGHAPLRLALSRSIGMRVLAPLLSEITRAFPRIEIKTPRYDWT